MFSLKDLYCKSPEHYFIYKEDPIPQWNPSENAPVHTGALQDVT